MGWASGYIARLQAGETVQFRPKGNSMTGKIESGQLCTVEPTELLQVGDIVLCRVNGKQYLHLVKAIQGKRFQIGNNRGRINGWIDEKCIFGKCQNRVTIQRATYRFLRLAMPSKVAERRIGRPGGVKNRSAQDLAFRYHALVARKV